MPKVRAIVFDAGGTLICPADRSGETYAEFAQRHGVKLAAEATDDRFLQGVQGLLAAREERGAERRRRPRVVEAGRAPLAAGGRLHRAPKVFDEFFEAVYLYFAKPEAWEVYPEVLEVLEALRDYPVDLVVLSNWDARLHSVLDGHGLGEYLPRRFISTELGWEKPDPAIYRHVAERLELPPGSLLSVGDSARNDVEAPRKAGWQAVQIERPKRDLVGGASKALKGR